MIHYRPYGDRAVLLQWEPRIDPAINEQVTELAQRLQEADWPGVNFIIPAYCSLTVGYDPTFLSYDQLCADLAELSLPPPAEADKGANSRLITIPVSYTGDHAPDMEFMCRHTGLSPAEIIALHCSVEYRVYMLGFLPGFPYMGTIPQALQAPRRSSPRKRVPAGAVGIAGPQGGIYPIEAPGGWQIIGRSPVQLFDPDRPSPFLLVAGDRVRFEPI